MRHHAPFDGLCRRAVIRPGDIADNAPIARIDIDGALPLSLVRQEVDHEDPIGAARIKDADTRPPALLIEHGQQRFDFGDSNRPRAGTRWRCAVADRPGNSGFGLVVRMRADHAHRR